VDSEKPQAKVKITVYTYEGRPSFEVPEFFSNSKINDMVVRRYGKQSNGKPHSWRGKPVD
jgi:hypothetical protein